MIDIFYTYFLQISLSIINNYLNIIPFTFLFQNEVSYDMNLKEMDTTHKIWVASISQNRIILSAF